MRTLFLISGNYGVGKTYKGKLLCGASNTVALAAPLRETLLRCFRGDTRLSSPKQEDKDAIFGASELKNFLKRERVKGVEKRLFLEFQQALAEIEDFRKVTVRDVLKLMGNSGRVLSKNYWVRLATKMLEEKTSPMFAVDDVRYVKEVEYLKKWAAKNNINVIHYYIGESVEGYENEKLRKMADYILTLEHLRVDNGN